MDDALATRAEDVHAGLRGDVRLLGALLGDVLTAREGRPFFELVEEVRVLSRRARAGDPELREAFRITVQGVAAGMRNTG